MNTCIGCSKYTIIPARYAYLLSSNITDSQAPNNIATSIGIIVKILPGLTQALLMNLRERILHLNPCKMNSQKVTPT